MRARGLRNPSPIVVGAIGLLVGIVYVLRIMIPSDMDPTIMLAFGEDSPAQAEYARSLVGEVSVRGAFGHDGQSFFLQAIDPWFLHPEKNAIYIDRPVYRGQRMGYPTIASGFGLFPPRVIVWTLPLLNVLALGVGSLTASRLAQHLGGSTWLGLAFCLNLGVLSEVDISGGGVVAMAFGIGAVLAAERGRLWPAALMFGGASLTRETMLASAAIVAWILWRRGRRGSWAVLIAPLCVVVAWGAYVRLRLSGLPSTGPRVFASYPLAGVVEAFEYWKNEPLNLLMVSAFGGVCVAFIARAVRSRQFLAWAAVPTLLIASVLSVSVWRYPYDIARVLTPVFLAFPFLAFIDEPDRSKVRNRVTASG